MDIHSHFVMLKDTPEEILDRANENGVLRAINIATCKDDIEKVFQLAKTHYPRMTCSLGIHPHDAGDWNEEIKSFIRNNAGEKEVVALGEMGLDYYYEHSDRETQKRAFKEQLLLAKELGLPVQIHTRDAEEDTIAILDELGGGFTGVIHCFTGTQYLADNALRNGLDISISGILTFKSADELRAVVETVPLDRLHVETDSPFLAPVPMRGKKNEPGFVVHTAQFLADLKNISIDELCEQVKKNNLRCFPKLAPDHF